MGGAFENSLPDTVFEILQPGDLLFVQSFGSVISWAIMYLTKSQVSHVAMYLAGRRIVHATLGGVVIEPIEVLFNSDTRVLPCTWRVFDGHRENIEESFTSTMATLYYDWYLVVRKGLRIIFGWDWGYFRWTFILDTTLILLMLDLPFILLFHYPVLTFLLPFYLLIILLSRVFSKKLPPSQGNPGQMLNGLFRSGEGKLLLDAHHIKQQLENER
jgi:hypothetical protein